MGVVLIIETAIGLVRAGIASAQAIVQAVRDNRASVTDTDGTLLTPEDVESRCAAAEAQRVATAASAEGRIASDGSVD